MKGSEMVGLFCLFYHAFCMLKLLNYCFLWFLDFLLGGAFLRLLFCNRKLSGMFTAPSCFRSVSDIS